MPNREEKSISAEDTFAADIGDPKRLQVELLRLADRTASRLRAQAMLAGTVNVKIRRADFSTYSRQRGLGTPTQETKVISEAARDLLTEWLAEQPRAAVRLLGVGVSDLRSPLQADLFAAEQPAAAKRLDVAVDGIRDRFGKGSLTRASLLPKPGT